MSTETTGDDSDRPDPAEPAETETQELLERLRSAPAEQVMAELFSTLLSTAQVKLGRRDARLFIDLCAQTLEYAGPYLPDELTTGVETALGQLRLAQVAAENEVAQQGEPEPHDVSRVPTSARNADRGDDGTDQPPAPPTKLWVPGR